MSDEISTRVRIIDAIGNFCKWIMHVAEIILVMAAFTVAYEISPTREVHIAVILVNAAGGFLIFTPLWQFMTRETNTDGAIQFLLTLAYLFSLVGLVLVMSNGFFDDVTSAVAKSLSK